MTEHEPYYQAARYPTKTAAGKAYTAIEQIIFDENCDLSAYRYLVKNEKKWYVVVIGEEPHPQLHERLKTILITLARGEPVTLDEDTITFLLQRRVEQSKQGPWVERHYSEGDIL
jgi:hypothetical protein